MWATLNIMSRYRQAEIPSQCKVSEASRRTCIEGFIHAKLRMPAVDIVFSRPTSIQVLSGFV